MRKYGSEFWYSARLESKRCMLRSVSTRTRVAISSRRSRALSTSSFSEPRSPSAQRRFRSAMSTPANWCGLSARRVGNVHFSTLVGLEGIGRALVAMGFRDGQTTDATASTTTAATAMIQRLRRSAAACWRSSSMSCWSRRFFFADMPSIRGRFLSCHSVTTRRATTATLYR